MAKAKTKVKNNVAEFPTGKTADNILEGYPVQDLSQNAKTVFGAMLASEHPKSSFDEISDATDFSFDELNTSFKELEEAGLVERLPELEFAIKAISAAGSEESGKDAENAENEANGEANSESFDILKEVDGSKLKEVVSKQEQQDIEAEAAKRTIRLPRNQRLAGMEESGEIVELEDKALSHEDCAHTKKIMNQKQETLRAEMLEIMKKHNLTKYEHGGFVIERESKGETVKVKSVKNKDDE